MGQARNRGTFDERTAQAIAAGRIKTAIKKEKIDVNLWLPSIAEVMAMMVLARRGEK